MFPVCRRRSAAGLVVQLASLAAAFCPSSALAADGTYTQILCANPDTGRGVGFDGQLPGGMTAGGTRGAAYIVQPTRCSTDRTVGGSDGIPVTPGSGATVRSGDNAWLRYEAPEGIGFEGAKLYRYGFVGTTWGWSVVGADVPRYLDAPRWETCVPNYLSCTTKGSTASPFGASNVTGVPTNESRGFKIFVACHRPDVCSAENQLVRLYGARVTLRDDLPPRIVGTPAGELVSDETVAGVASVNLAAEDGGAGVYRVIVKVDGEEVVSEVASSNGGRCADVNEGNDDPYEFAHGQPCSSAIDGIYALDTMEVTDGAHDLLVQVEDAAGKRATVVDRRVVVDNYPPPVVASPPVLEGSPRQGSSLAVTPAVFDDHGAPGDLSVTRTWQRCRSTCVDVGDGGLSYTLDAADVGSRIRVIERARNSEGSAESTSVQTSRVTRVDGTLPPNDDEVDNDCDGVVDEADEPAACPEPVDPGPTPTVPPPSKSVSSVGATGAAGSAGRDGANGTTSASSSVGPVNGENASARASLTAKFGAAGAKGSLRYGKTLTATGRLVDEQGRAIRNAIVDVLETPAINGAKTASGSPVVTNGDGEFSYKVTGKAGSRSVSFLYRYQRQGAVVAQSTLALRVKAGVKLAVRLKGITASYSGKVLAGSMPRGGKLVIVQGRAKGASWQTFASRRATKSGVFKGKYRLKVRRPGKKLQFRVRVLSESGWNFGGATSKAVTRTVK